jgi:hypothetical protein
MRDEVTGGWRKLHNEELHNLYSSPCILRMIKSTRMRRTGHVARMGEKRNTYRILGYIMPFHKYILNFLQCNVFAQNKLVVMTFEVTQFQKALQLHTMKYYHSVFLPVAHVPGSNMLQGYQHFNIRSSSFSDSDKTNGMCILSVLNNFGTMLDDREVAVRVLVGSRIFFSNFPGRF